MSKVIVVGGGAAGMMAAISAAKQGHRVLLLEQNEKLGKKLYITGKGRCNVTNACEMDKLFENVVTNSKFLYSAFYGFDNQQMMAFLEAAGCRLKTERGERVFPVSDHASDVIAALQRLLQKEKVEVRLHTRVDSLYIEETNVSSSVWPEKEEQTLIKQISGVCLANGKKESADAVVLATGGISYPTTGATGDGYRMAQAFGHTVKDCMPALAPFEIEQEWCASLQGLSLKNISLKMFLGKKELYSGFGEMLFTHFGISGPLVLSASSFYAKAKNKDNITMELDLKPALSEEQLDKRLLRDFDDNHNRQFKNALNGLFPARLIPVMIMLSGIVPEKKVNDITKEERKAFVHMMKHLALHIKGVRGFTEAIITQGGINVKEVNPSTMESKLVRGLFFAGEMLDVDALTGGYNLQIAWSTGHLAGNSIT